MSAVVVEWLKWPATPYRTTPMTRLGRDDQGIWLFGPKGAAASYASYGPTPLAANFLTLIPVPEQWWVCTWMWGDPDTTIDIYVDIVAPPSWRSSACLRVVDLDLDVIRDLNGRVSIEDEDDFAHHSTSLHYPHSVISSARRAANQVVRNIDGQVEPFNEAPSRWLDIAESLNDGAPWQHSTAALSHRNLAVHNGSVISVASGNVQRSSSASATMMPSGPRT